MRNPGGYGRITNAVGRVRLDDGRQLTASAVEEHDTFTCGHCCRVVMVQAKADPADVGGLCKQCMKLICPHCLDAGNCSPLEARLKEQEQRYHALRSYGVL